MENLAKRLRYARSMRKMTQIELAEASGVGQSDISKIERGDIQKTTALLALARALIVNANWLDTGDGNWSSPSTGNNSLYPVSKSKEASNVEPGPDYKPRRYPVISDVQAGQWTEICETFTMQDAEEWHLSAHDLGDCGYMLRVKGKSMMNPHGRYTFPPGSLLEVTPEPDPLPNQFVVVRRAGENAATFKRLVLLDGVLYLEAVNPDWPERYIKLQDGDVFCGVARAVRNELP